MNKIINIEVTNRTVPVRFDVVQYSTEPAITFRITDWEVSGSAQLYIEKPSGSKIYNNCTIDGQDIIYQPTTQSFAETGTNICQLRVVKSSGDMVSFPMFANVVENHIDDSAVESQDEFAALVEALSTVSQYDTRIGAVETGLSTAQDDITSIEGDVSTLQGDVSTLQGDVSSVQTQADDLTSDIYYQVGETVQLNTQGAGYSTVTSGNYYFFLALPKKLPDGATITATAFKTSIRGVGGRCTNNADNLENISSTSRRVDGTLTVALTGITNLFQANTPAHIIADITFTIS